MRPATGALLGVGSISRVYRIDPRTAAATAVGAPFSPAVDPDAAGVGVDVNPTVDRIRLVTTGGQNLRLNPDTGAVAVTDTSLSYAPGDPAEGGTPAVSGAAYTNSAAGATTTVLYDLNSANDSLVTRAPPNAGTLNTVGSTRVRTDATGGFDIAAEGVGIAALRLFGSATSGLYCVDLGTGAARLVNRIATGVAVTGLAVAPRGVRLGR